MYIGMGIFLLVTGAVLKYALSVDVDGLSIPGIGGVLMWGGVLALFLSFIQTWAGRQIATRQRNAAMSPPPQAPPTTPAPSQPPAPGYVDERTWVYPQEPPDAPGSGRS